MPRAASLGGETGRGCGSAADPPADQLLANAISIRRRRVTGSGTDGGQLPDGLQFGQPQGVVAVGLAFEVPNFHASAAVLAT